MLDQYDSPLEKQIGCVPHAMIVAKYTLRSVKLLIVYDSIYCLIYMVLAAYQIDFYDCVINKYLAEQR